MRVCDVCLGAVCGVKMVGVAIGSVNMSGVIMGFAITGGVDISGVTCSLGTRICVNEVSESVDSRRRAKFRFQRRFSSFFFHRKNSGRRFRIFRAKRRKIIIQVLTLRFFALRFFVFVV